MKKHKWSKLVEAFEYAAQEHQHQLRKSTDIPYISHLMSVSALVLEHGGSEDQAIAGLLHDVIEDAKPPSRIPEIKKEIHKQFGSKVLELVEGCTDGEPDAKGKKADWKTRKVSYLARMKKKSPELLLVSCCDKLHNARAILTDLVTHGNSVFDRFTAAMKDTLWYYRSISEVFSKKLKGTRGEVVARELAETVSAIEQLAEPHDGNPIEIEGAIHHLEGRNSNAPTLMIEISILPSQMPTVIEQLRKKGGEASWAVFMFYTPRISTKTDDDCPNLQYSIQNGKVGIDWVLLGQRNIADKAQISKFIASKGHKVTEMELNDVSYLRVENGDITELGLSIVEEFYKMPPDADVGILVSGFPLSLGGKRIH